jgi:hypothetical protein
MSWSAVGRFWHDVGSDWLYVVDGKGFIEFSESWQRHKMRLRWAENRGGAGHPGGVEIIVGRAAWFLFYLTYQVHDVH